jgi:hypothetical protein
MRRELPPRPHLDHLKKQAKDLLDAQQRAEPEALERIRDALPALAGQSAEQIAKASFALHDAQSAIAREYGYASWRELRAAVQNPLVATFSEQNLRAAWAAMAPSGTPQWSPEVYEAIRDAYSGVRRDVAAQLAAAGVPARLPLVPVRNALLLPGSIAPFALARPASIAAADTARTQSSSLLATFAQRAESDEDITLQSLHPVGSLALLHKRLPDTPGMPTVIVLQSIRPIRLLDVEQPSQPGGARHARVEAFDMDLSDGAQEVPALEESLRQQAQQLMAALPDPERASALLDQFDETDLADIIVANVPCSVAEKAAYAAEPRLVERLRLALHMTQRLTGAGGIGSPG